MEEEIVPALLGRGAVLQENEVDLLMPLLDLNSILRLEPVADSNEEGSLTPTTKAQKVQLLNNIKVNTIDIKEYNSIVQPKKNETKQLLNQEINELESQINACQIVVEIKKGDKLFQACNASISILKEELRVNGEKLNKLRDSVLTPEIDDDNIFSFTTIYQQDIHNVGQVSDDLPAVLHYGLYIESQLLKDLIGNYIQNGVLHPCENAIFLEAFKYLQQVESAESYLKTPLQNRVEYPQNVILVDIFDRSTNVINEGRNQTHTIALWKNKDNEIVLIDPSKRSYSDHLLEAVRALGEINVEIFAAPVIYGIASYGQDTGYSSYEEEAPKPRDCVDIAVKIAFELNEQHRLCGSLKQLENNMLEQISNQLNQAKYLNKFEKLVIRELQSSNFEVRTTAKNLLVSLNHSLPVKSPLTKLIRFDKIKNYRDIEELEKTCKALEKFI